jgi:hypothetical protein
MVDGEPAERLQMAGDDWASAVQRHDLGETGRQEA